MGTGYTDDTSDEELSNGVGGRIGESSRSNNPLVQEVMSVSEGTREGRYVVIFAVVRGVRRRGWCWC